MEPLRFASNDNNSKHMKCRKCNIIGILLLTTLFGLVYLSYQNKQDLQSHFEQEVISINGYQLNVDVVTTAKDQARGLAGKSDLADDYGMLFVFDNSQVRQFWMRDMLVPIDIIWIDGDIIIGFIDSVQPETDTPIHELKLYSSEIAVDKVLEVRAGLRIEKDWDVGTKIDL